MAEQMLYDCLEVAEAIGVSRTKVYKLINRGVLPSIRVGGVIRVPVGALREWIANGTVGARSTAA